MADAHLARSSVLMEQRRYADAEEELRALLAASPGHAEAHARLAICLAQRKAIDEAHASAATALRLAPDQPLSHAALASVFEEQERYAQAEAAMAEAVRLAPDNAALHASLAALRLAQQRWGAALEAAERALALDPEEVDAHNVRALAQTQLGKPVDAQGTLRAALAKDPSNASSHAALGWALLHARDHRGALDSFKESLRLDPTLDWAREGLIQALHARNPLYRVLLRYFLWMSRLSPRTRWVVIIGGMAFSRLLGPLRILWLLFVLSTWLGEPLMNLLLRLDRYGRLVLSRDQVTASNWIGGGLTISLALFAAAVLTTSGALAVAGLVTIGLLVPLAATFGCRPGRRRWVMAVSTAVIAGLFLAAGVLLLVSPEGSGDDTGTALAGFGLLGLIASGFLGNALAGERG